MAAVPLIDLSMSDIDVAAALLDAYGSVGFAGLVNHGVDQTLLASIFEASARFHELPEDHKRKIELDEHHRGYIPLGTSTDSASEYEDVIAPNASESFMMLGDSSGGFLAGPNQWPKLDGFRDAVEAYHQAAEALARRLIRCFARALDDRQGEMESMFEAPTTWLRLLRYPPQPASEFGSAPHRDYGAITLLAQQDVPGLDVLGPDGTWLELEADPAVLVLNTGEVMHRWSNGRLLRTPHRVINRSGRERFSIPFFFDPDVRASIEPLACCVSPSDPPRFEAIGFEAFIQNELTAGYRRHQKSSTMQES